MSTELIIQKKSAHQERFMVVSGKKIKSIPVWNVAYFVSDGRYIRLVTKSNEKYLLDYSLETLSQKIDPEAFFRVNRQFIISFDAISEMTAWSRSRIKIELDPLTETEVITSIQNTAGFRKWLGR